MASPHVAGAAAVVLGTQPTLSPAQVSSVVISNTTANAIRNATAGTANRLLYSPASASPAPVGNAPAAPTGVSAVAVAGKAATVSWVKGSDGGSALTKQTLYVYNGTTLVKTVVLASTATTFKVTGLTAGRSYKFALKATNAIGTSPLSAYSNNITALR